MVTREWKLVEHQLIKNRGMRYVQLEIDKDTKAIVDTNPIFYGLLSFPTIHPWQKFDMYTITKNSKEFDDESFLVDANDIEESKKMAKKASILPALAGILFSLSGISSVISFQIVQNTPFIISLIFFGITFFSLRFIILEWLVKRKFSVLKNKSFEHVKQGISLKVRKRAYTSFVNVFLQTLGVLLLLLSIVFPLSILAAVLLLNLACLLNVAMPIGSKVYIKLNDNI